MQRFLDKTFSNQELYPLLSRVVKSIEGEIALKLPEELARSQGYRILTHTECKVSYKIFHVHVQCNSYNIIVVVLLCTCV